ncbi:hypothetical protein Lepto7375DRAFT_3890 [Leptolyngbya sp. PCC 7375]|nr:hypothetical protein Lepto7375DRAFT_3890 [Leptolyngbya sp. PCC 7375]
MRYCLCCNHSLLRHIRQNSLYWYCPSCRQAMPEATVGVQTQRLSLHRPRQQSTHKIAL